MCKDLKSSFCFHTQHHSGNLLVMLQLLIPVNCWNEFTVSFFFKGFHLLVIYQWNLTVWKGLVSLRLAVFVVVVFLLCFSLPLLLNLSLSAFISVFDSLCLSLSTCCFLSLMALFTLSYFLKCHSLSVYCFLYPSITLSVCLWNAGTVILLFLSRLLTFSKDLI